MTEAFLEELTSSSEEEEVQWDGSCNGKAPNEDRDCDCFNGRDSVHDEKDFERRFGMSRTPFDGIHDALMGTDPLVQKCDSAGKMGIRPFVKLVACMPMTEKMKICESHRALAVFAFQPLHNERIWT